MNIKFGKIFPKIEEDPPKSLAVFALTTSYNNLRTKQSLDSFIKTSKQFEKSIFLSLDSDEIQQDQKQLIKIIVSLINILLKISPVFTPYFQDHIFLLMRRLSSARIDQKIIEKESFSSLWDTKYPYHLGLISQHFIGKLFMICENQNKEKSVISRGSAIFCCWSENSILDLTKNQKHVFNAILSCQHSYKIKPSLNFKGIYFVQNSFLDSTSGFPKIAIQNTESLVLFLENDENSFRIAECFSKFQNEQLFSHMTKLEYSSPNYCENEDINVGLITLKANQNFPLYMGVISILFSAISKKLMNFIENNQIYFAGGFLQLNQYDTRKFVNHPHYKIITEKGITPLVFTSEHCQREKNKEDPLFKNGEIKYSAPVGSGMSGGPLFVCFKDSVEIIGVINGNKHIDYYFGSY